MPTQRELASLYIERARVELASLSEAGVLLVGSAFPAVLLVKGAPGPAELAGDPLLSGPDGDALRSALDRLGYPPDAWAACSAFTLAAETPCTPPPHAASEVPGTPPPHAAPQAPGSPLASVPRTPGAPLTSAPPVPGALLAGESRTPGAPFVDVPPAPGALLAGAPSAPAAPLAGAPALTPRRVEPRLLALAVEVFDPEAVLALDTPAARLLHEAWQLEAPLPVGSVTRVRGRRVLALGGFEAALSADGGKQAMWSRLKHLPPLTAPL